MESQPISQTHPWKIKSSCGVVVDMAYLGPSFLLKKRPFDSIIYTYAIGTVRIVAHTGIYGHGGELIPREMIKVLRTRPR